MLPTLNEAENIEPLTRAILAISADTGVVIVDDRSSDGTREKAEKLAAEDRRVALISREGKKGRGLAGREGFLFALDSGAEFIVEMDADLSHDPAFIPAMVKTAAECDIVIGSRFMRGGSDERRSFARVVISRSAKAFINVLFGTSISDPTSGFRCFRRGALKTIGPETLEAETPFIVLESLYRGVRRGLAIKEIPIKFHPRKGEKSKLRFSILLRCFFDLIRLRFGPRRYGPGERP